MRKTLAIIATLAIAINAQAALQVIWSGTEGFVRADGVTPIGTGLADGAPTYLAQFLFSPSGTRADVQPGGVPTGDNVILASVVVNNADADYAPLPPESFTGAFEAGFVFARVFDVGSFDTATIVAGSRFYEGPTLAAADEPDPSVFQNYSIHTGSAGFPGFQTDVLSGTVIPEPSVFALLGLGSLVLMIRRRFVNA